MSNDESVQDIIAQLQNLQIQQAVLLTRLGRLSSEGNRNSNSNYSRPEPPATENTTRDFAIGDRVRIRNPGVFQTDRGSIVKIGTTRITVLARNGTKIVRAPKNLIFDNE
jgi:hypothetical protein